MPNSDKTNEYVLNYPSLPWRNSTI